MRAFSVVRFGLKCVGIAAGFHGHCFILHVCASLQPEEERWKKWNRRFWTTLAMIFGFFGYLHLTRTAGLVTLIIGVQSLVYRELVKIQLNKNKEMCVLSPVSAFSVMEGPADEIVVSDRVCFTACPRRKLPGFGLFYIYWFVVAVIFMYGGSLKEVLLVSVPLGGVA